MESQEQSLYELFNCHRHFYIENQRKLLWRTVESKVTKQQDKKKAIEAMKGTINILLSDQTSIIYCKAIQYPYNRDTIPYTIGNKLG